MYVWNYRREYWQLLIFVRRARWPSKPRSIPGRRASYCLDRAAARAAGVSISQHGRMLLVAGAMSRHRGPGIEFLAGVAKWFAPPRSSRLGIALRLLPIATATVTAARRHIQSVLGVFSFLGGAAHAAGDMLRRMWNTDDAGVIGAATTRFLMLTEDLNNVRTRGEERLGDLWAFESVRPSWWPSDKPQLDKSRRAWMSRLGTLLLLNAFVKRGLEVRPRFEWIGRADTDAAYNISAVSWRLAAIRQHLLQSGSSTTLPPAVYGPFGEWLSWKPASMTFSCWAHGPNRWQTAMQALQANGRNASALPKHQKECVEEGVTTPFPFAGGPLAVYSRSAIHAIVSTSGFREDEARLRNEMDSHGGKTLPDQLGRHNMIAEDVYYAHLIHQARQQQSLVLINSQFMEYSGSRSTMKSMLEDGCELQQEMVGGKLSARIYHGLKEDKDGWEWILNTHRWLLQHETSEKTSCEAFDKRAGITTRGEWRT